MEILSTTKNFNKTVLVLTESTFGIALQLAEQGLTRELTHFLNNVNNEKNEQGDTSAEGLNIIKSPLVIRSAQIGQREIVEYLIKCFSNIACIRVWPLGATNSTAIHEATEHGHLDILKFLIQSGVSVNHRKDHNGYTPLHSAICSRKGNSQERIVQYLINHGANVNALDIENNSPLYTAVHKIVSGVCGKENKWLQRIVQLLLDSGACISHAAVDGRTMLHLIARKNSRTSQLVLNMLLESKPDDVWKLLLTPSKGRKYTELSALLYAAEWKNKPFIDFITSQPQCPPDIAADVLLALSTSMSAYPIQMVRELWERALQNRKRGRLAELQFSTDSEECKNRVEISTLDEVAQLTSAPSASSNSIELHYQFLMMCERIFGKGSRATIQFLWSLGHKLCENSKFAEADRLFLRALKMMQLNLTGEYDQPGCYTDYHSLLSTFDREVIENQSLMKEIARMLSANYKPDFRQYVRYELEIAKHLQSDSVSKLTQVLYQALSLLAAWSYDQQKLNNTAIVPKEISELGQELVTRCTTEQSLLTQASFIAETQKPCILSDEHNSYISFMVDTIFQWGVGSINAMDSKGKRPLHVAAAPSNVLCNTNGALKGVSVISLLVENGAHLDAVDSEGCTAYGACSDQPECKAITALSSPLPLMCLTSHAVVATQISYTDLTCIPLHIIHFIKLHDPRVKKNTFEHKLSDTFM